MQTFTFKLNYHTMLNHRLVTVFIFTLFLAAPAATLSAQDTDPYSDYSHLWAEKTKKKKSKKKKGKQNTPVVASDTLQLPVDSLSMPVDSLNVASDSLSTERPAPSDSTKVEQPTEEVTSPEVEPAIENTPEPAEEDVTIDEPIEEPTEVVQEEPKKEKEKKPKKERPDTSNDLPVDDFRSGMETAEGGGNFTGGFTYTQIGDEAFVGMVLSPEFKLGKVGVGLNIPILYGLDSKSVRTEIFKDGAGAARLVRYLRYGVQKKDPVYVKVGELQGTMMGFGGLINNYTNSTSYEKRKVGLHYDFNVKGLAGIEGLYSDFDPSSFNLFAIRPYVRPFSQTPIPIVKTFELGAMVIKDKDQTARPTSDSTSTSYAFTSAGVGAFGVDMGVTLLRVPFIQIDLFATYSKLNVTASDTLNQAIMAINGDDVLPKGSGFSTGINFRMHFIADVFSTDIRIERLSYQEHYLPQFFDASYEINKDARILSLANAPKMSGIYGSLTGHILQKVELGGSLLIPDDVTEESPAVVQVRADMERLADKFSLHGSYIKGNLTDLGDAFTFDERSLAKMRVIYHMNSFLAVGLDYYWAFTPIADGSYEANKYVMPYFGVSIDF